MALRNSLEEFVNACTEGSFRAVDAAFGTSRNPVAVAADLLGRALVDANKVRPEGVRRGSGGDLSIKSRRP